MQELITVNYDNADFPTVSGRELHEALKIETRYNDWFKRMCEYGFTEGNDYYSILSNRSDGLAGKPRADHALKISMAKELCMIQRTEIGKKIRQYFISVEEQWNSPEAIMARALKISNAKLVTMQEEMKELESKNYQLETTVAVQTQQIAELQPKASYYDVILNCKDLMSISSIAKDYGKSAIWLNKWLYEHHVQYKQGDIWLLYQKYAENGYTSTKTSPYAGKNGEYHNRVHTYWTQKGRIFIYELLKENGILPVIEREKNKPEN